MAEIISTTDGGARDACCGNDSEVCWLWLRRVIA
jgi:hypothetical protein